jgi:diguanylate cyclase (GGDEF)-like protein
MIAGYRSNDLCGGVAMHVVLVDSGRTALKFITRLLEAREHEVHPFVDGREAIGYIRSHPDVDALITSTTPVSMSGIELCWETRLVAGTGRPIYIILMSSNADEQTVIEALDSGADDFIGKPPAVKELYARLRSAERLATLQRDLIRLATTDPLTGLLNRRAFFERGSELCDRAGPGGAPTATLIDIDHFKRVNDVYGHDVGDEAIRAVSRLARSAGEVVGRLGGEEFVILHAGRTLAGAAALADGLREAIARMEIATERGPLTLTCSFGVSEWIDGDSVDRLLKRADLALYAAKSGGRNRVVAADAEACATLAANPNSVIRARMRSEVAADAYPVAADAGLQPESVG